MCNENHAPEGIQDNGEWLCSQEPYGYESVANGYPAQNYSFWEFTPYSLTSLYQDSSVILNRAIIKSDPASDALYRALYYFNSALNDTGGIQNS